MLSLSEYHALEDRARELRNEIDLREQLAELQAQLDAVNKKLKAQIKLTSKYRTEARKLRTKYQIKPISRNDRAVKLLADRANGLEITLKHIAEACFLSYSTVKTLNRDVRAGKLTPRTDVVIA